MGMVFSFSWPWKLWFHFSSNTQFSSGGYLLPVCVSQERLTGNIPCPCTDNKDSTATEQDNVSAYKADSQFQTPESLVLDVSDVFSCSLLG